MKVAVVGAGYVGLTTACALAWIGHDVCVVELDEGKLTALQAGTPPFYEVHLDDALQACSERLHFTAAHAEALDGAEVAFIAVGTPPDETGGADLRQVHEAVGQVLGCMSPTAGHLVLVTKSTVPVGTGDVIAERVRSLELEHRVSVASNPEFLRQGRSLHDSLYPDRIVVGGQESALDVLRRLYRPIVERCFDPLPGTCHPDDHQSTPVFEVDRRSAELSKYAANGFLAMRISYINEVANLCEAVDADVASVAKIIGADPRIGPHFLHAGVGYGGSCFPKDTRALHRLASDNGYEFELISAAIRVNATQRLRVVDKLESALGALAGKRIALLGLSFKPGTDDVREAPSIKVARDLAARGARVVGHDPQAEANARLVLPGVVGLADSVTEALYSADAAVLMTEWPEYLALTSHDFRVAMRRPLIVDGRNALSDEVRAGVEYYAIGRRRATGAKRRRHASASDAHKGLPRPRLGPVLDEKRRQV